MGHIDSVAHGGNNRIFIPVWSSYNVLDEIFHIMQHELGHCYDAHEDHLPPTTPVSIMGNYWFNNNFLTHLFHSDNFDFVEFYCARFDGPP